ncbi:hypothetical protein FSP39_025518, partial [Pinctada imbricata]
QHTLLSLSSSLAVSILVADVVCAEQNEELKSRILSSNFLMNGLTTIIMNLFGIRLPLYQGSADDYLVPLIAMQVINQDRCSIQNHLGNYFYNFPVHEFVKLSKVVVISIFYHQLQGSLIAAGLCHFLIGFSGMVAVLLKFIGPITIVPTIFLAITFFTRTTTKFAMAYWGVSLPVAAMAVILSIYLANHSCPIPFWSRKKGFHLTRYPVHQVFSLLIAMLIGWTICGIMTAAGVFSDDPSSREYLARTDAKTAFVEKAPWFNVPYPGQFGPYKFSISVFVGFIIATITSILDSIGDYYACAKMCEVPPPPPHAVNRGIAIEGLMSTLSGFVGCGHATSTYGGNIGAIGITRVSLKVASRDVFLATGIIYVIFGMIGKVSAVFLTIPYPVLGGALIVMFGMFTGVVLSNLQVVSLSSSRNLAIIGLSILFGLMIPYWIEKYPDQISLGSEMGTNVLKMLLATPSISGGMLACFLDNTVPGTLLLNSYNSSELSRRVSQKVLLYSVSL